MRSVTVPGGDVEQVPTSPDAMKAEIGYPDVVMGDFIQDLIGDIEHNMRLAPPNDQYFEELSIQKFTCNSCSGRLAGMKETLPPP